MLVAADDADIGAAGPVQHRRKGHFEPAVAGGKAPRAHKVIPAVLLRDPKGQAVQLVGNAVVKQHIFAGSAGIPKAVADIKAEGAAVYQAVAAAPVPGVFIGPDAAAPVQCGEGLGRVKLDNLPIPFHPAGGPHTVDLLVVIKGLFIFGKGGHNHHGILRRVGQGEFRRDRLAVQKIFDPGRQAAGAVRQHLKAEIGVLAPRGDVSGGTAGREPRFAAGEGEDDIDGAFPRPRKIQQRKAQKAHVAVVVNGQGDAPAVVHDQVVIPLLDAVGGGADGPAVVLLNETAGKAGFAQLALLVQQRAGGGQFFLHGGPP